MDHDLNGMHCNDYEGERVKAYEIIEEHRAGCDVIKTRTRVEAVDRDNDGRVDGLSVGIENGVAVTLSLDHEKYDWKTDKCSGVKGSLPWLSMYDFLFSEGR